MKPGGRFIAVVPQFNDQSPTTPKYDYTYNAPSPLTDGSRVTVTLYSNGQPNCSFENYYWRAQTYEMTLATAGFHDLTWHSLAVSTEGIKRFGPAFWQDFLRDQSMQILVATK